MNKQVIGVIVGGILIAGAAFAGGYVVSSRTASAADPRAAFSQLSQADREAMASMTDEERQAFFKEKGIEMPTGGAGGMMGAPGGTGQQGARGGALGAGPGGNQVLEGTVTSIAGDKVSLTLTGGGSAKVYVDDATVIAAVDGRKAALAEGTSVIVIARAEATGVSAATTVVVK